ncbi:DUF1636 family protein [Jannaschia marina]|uniref:DUF1636 family protein n=1 Tax=Jannaschia marina TaxID=2741674 RepID=UPI0015CBA18E|nr:DUF1636 domain-containing protein [Jannaschia marina]
MEHRITICTSCRHKGTTCRPGLELIERLRQAIAAAGDALPAEFEISGVACMAGCDRPCTVACMAGCDRPCTVAYHGTRKATYLFGDIDPETDIDDLLSFARRYAAPGDGWCSASERTGKLRRTTLARVPAAVFALEDCGVRAS